MLHLGLRALELSQSPGCDPRQVRLAYNRYSDTDWRKILKLNPKFWQGDDYPGCHPDDWNGQEDDDYWDYKDRGKVI